MILGEFFPAIKALHLTCIVISFCGFLLRFGLVYRQSILIKHPIVRVLPHINDTLLFSAGIMMAIILFPNISAVPIWLWVKLSLLCGYILLGVVALTPSRQPWQRIGAFILAIMLFITMVMIAL